MLTIKIFVFIFGILVGSFLNVVIYRMPRQESVIKPRSKCPSCSILVKWYQNIPILSYIILRGKCANCSVKISIKYPLIELLCGFIAVLLLPQNIYAIDIHSIAFFLMNFSIACSFIAHFFIDIEHQILPDKINIYLLLTVLLYSSLTQDIYFWLTGGLLGFLGTYMVTWLFYKIRGQIGLGGGDIKLFGILGVLFGPVGVLHNIFMSCFLGAILGLALIGTKKMTKDTEFAFGPAIIIMAAIQHFFPRLFEYINPFYF